MQKILFFFYLGLGLGFNKGLGLIFQNILAKNHSIYCFF